MEDYQTVVEALQGLKSRGFTLDFNLANGTLHSSSENIYLQPDDFRISEIYRFEGMSYPGDNDILYTVKTNEGDKGILVCPYGAYAESFNILPQLKIERECR